MHRLPFTFEIALPAGIPTEYDNHITRSLSSMRGQYADQQAYDAQLAQEDVLLYEVYEIRRPESSGELLNGISIVHPGTVGDEYFMTKGHFHAVLETAEVYYCLAGEGYMVMETPEGESSVAELRPGKVLYVPPRWAHRSVNIGADRRPDHLLRLPGPLPGMTTAASKNKAFANWWWRARTDRRLWIIRAGRRRHRDKGVFIARAGFRGFRVPVGQGRSVVLARSSLTP